MKRYIVTIAFLLFATANTMAASVAVLGNGRVTAPPLIDCRSTGGGCTLPADRTVTLTATPDTGNVFMGWSGACSGKSPTCQVKGDFKNQVQVTATFKRNIYLLLHGMSSDATIAWNDLVNAKFGRSCTEMIGASFGDSSCTNSCTNKPPANQQCFRINFTKRTLMGLENQKEWSRGDGATFNQLGTEVGDAVTRISGAFPDSVITLVGHSRGGLAARAFLQSSSSSRSKVVGLLTIGTPHNGSPFGRIYGWLRDHSRPTCMSTGSCSTAGSPSPKDLSLDWGVANLLLKEGKLDVRSPTIGFLATGSDEINKLNRGVGGLDRNIQYAQIVSNSVYFGVLKQYYGIPVDIWPSLSIPARNYINQQSSTNPGRDSNGDGIVPLDSQRMNRLSGFPGSVRETILTGVLHIGETGRTIEIINALDSMAKAK